MSEPCVMCGVEQGHSAGCFSHPYNYASDDKRQRTRIAVDAIGALVRIADALMSIQCRLGELVAQTKRQS